LLRLGDTSTITWAGAVIAAGLKTSFVRLVRAVRKESFAIAEVRSWKTATSSCVQSQALYYQQIRISTTVQFSPRAGEAPWQRLQRLRTPWEPLQRF
jgi:hypothetical protein